MNMMISYQELVRTFLSAVDTRFICQGIFFNGPLDNMNFFRLFSKRAATAAASLGRSGR